jgi:signal transduction histidine kinase
MVQTIVRNLLSNAIKFTNRGGSVIIRTEIKSMNNVCISVIDNGVGIEKSSLAKIFDISNKLHTTGTENERSTGLGLMLVKDFVEKNKGTITIDSEKGKGTIVSFTLPTIQGH